MHDHTQEEIDRIFKEIDALSREDMARLHRFAPAGHIYFNSSLPFHKHFEERFKSLGGMTPEISKQIGWD